MIPASRILLMTYTFIGLLSQGFPAYNSTSFEDSEILSTIIRNFNGKTHVDQEFLYGKLRSRRQSLNGGCIMPKSMSNGTYSLRGTVAVEGGQLAPHHSILQLMCPPGYISSSSQFNFCDDIKNDWFSEVSTCQKMCQPPKSLTVTFTCSVRGESGKYDRGSCDRMLPPGSTATGECREGHRSVNVHRQITCIDGRWGYSMPRCEAECGQVTPLGRPNVINGTDVVRGEFPWHVAVYTQYGQEDKGLSPKYWCGGSVISRNLVVSAAHCFYNPLAKRKLDVDLFAVAVGKVYSDYDHSEETMDNFIQKSELMRIEIPEDYEGVASSYGHDIALLIIKNPFSFSNIIMPVCFNLLDKNFDEELSSPGSPARVAGFGLVDVRGSASDVLKTAAMPIISKRRCKSESPPEFSKYIIWDKLCAGQTNGTGVCKGDSGGGLVVSSLQRNNPIWYLTGIVSTSPASDTNEECSTNTYSTFTRLFLHKEFIEDIIYQQGCVMPNNPSNGKFKLIGLRNAEPGKGVAHKSQMTLKCTEGFVTSDRENNICDEFINDWIKEFAVCNVVSPTSQPLPGIDPLQNATTMTMKPTSSDADVKKNHSDGPMHSDYKMFCYFTDWAWYRPGVGRYGPDDIDISLCSHIVYGFAILDAKRFVIRLQDSYTDIENKFYERVTAYKHKGAKVLLALGGSSDSTGDKYSRLVNDPVSRQQFAKRALKFVMRHNFDGLTLDWEFPVCWEGDCNKGPTSDREGFSALIKTLRELFEPNNLMLTAGISPKKQIIDIAYDIPSLSMDLDYIMVMTYDYHKRDTENKTSHVAPLYEYTGDANKEFNVNYTINYLISRGIPRSKLILGLPLFGRSFSLENVNDHGFNAPFYAGGEAGDFTFEVGFLSYYEICDRVKNRQWQVVRDAENRVGPYAFNGEQWVSFDDATMLKQKISYMKDMGLAGGMVWALDLDDFRGSCDCEAYPLLSAIGRDLSFIKTPQPNCTVESMPESVQTASMPQSLPTQTTETPDQNANVATTSSKVPFGYSGYKVICYFDVKSWYRNGDGKYSPEDIDPSLCTHIVYAFAVLDSTRLTINPGDYWADIHNELYVKVTALKAKDVKVLIGIGGWNDSLSDKYSRLVQNDVSRAKFVTDAVEFIQKWQFDGLDLNWEFPRCWQANCNAGFASDKQNFAKLVRELREAFTPRGLLLSAVVSASRTIINLAYDVPSLAADLDWMAVLAYDYYKSVTERTTHIAPLYYYPGDDYGYFNVNFSMNYWMQKGAPSNKLVLGMPMFGQSFTLVNSSENGFNDAASGFGEAGEYTDRPGILAYNEICDRVKQHGWTIHRDEEDRVGSWASKENQWVSFEDTNAVSIKTQIMKLLGLDGVMVWSLDMDDFRDRCGCGKYPLLRTINAVLGKIPSTYCDF